MREEVVYLQNLCDKNQVILHIHMPIILKYKRRPIFGLIRGNGLYFHVWGYTEPILGIFQTYNWLLCYIWIKTSLGQAREKGLKNLPLSYLDLVESVAHKLAINVRWNLTITQKKIKKIPLK